MNEELLSIIVAVYNVEKYLNKCIETIVNQTYRKLEIILVDDGSSDSSRMICDQWAKRDFRIRVIHKQNGGLSDARNIGLQAAQGKWIGFIDGDDYVKLDMFEKLFKNRTKNGITICGYFIVENNHTSPCNGIDEKLSPKEAVSLYLKNELDSISAGSFTYFGSYAWNKLYDRKVFDNISYPKQKKFEDMYIMLNLIYQSNMIRIIPDCEYYYVQRKSSITHLKSIQTDALEARKKQKEELEQFWGIQDSRIDKLILLEYVSILKKYAIVSRSEREKYTNLQREAWGNLNHAGYRTLPFKIQMKLLLCGLSPKLYRFLYEKLVISKLN